MTTNGCCGAEAAITRADGVLLMPIVERPAPVRNHCVATLPRAHRVRDPWQGHRVVPVSASRAVRIDEDPLDMSATYRLYSSRMHAHMRECMRPVRGRIRILAPGPLCRLSIQSRRPVIPIDPVCRMRVMPETPPPRSRTSAGNITSVPENAICISRRTRNTMRPHGRGTAGARRRRGP